MLGKICEVDEYEGFGMAVSMPFLIKPLPSAKMSLKLTAEAAASMAGEIYGVAITFPHGVTVVAPLKKVSFHLNKMEIELVHQFDAHYADEE
ncbi:MAG: hypothetical protein KAJ73_00625 [Zetaproteobacteria bacterium]|nr:hypothetical protein [Zetaproteobacteria bacterium]